jgi:hypothetical protein
VQQHKGPRDLVLDLDEIMRDVLGTHGHELPNKSTDDIGRAMLERNRRLASVRAGVTRVWLVLSAPSADTRRWWQRKLDAELIECNPGMATCMKRAEARPYPMVHQAAVLRWFRASKMRAVVPVKERMPARPAW